MAFLRRTDYLKIISNENLSVVVDDDDSIRKDAELATRAEMESYLLQRYDVLKVFKDLDGYNNAASYTTGDLIAFPDTEDPVWQLTETDIEGEDVTISGESPIDEPTKWTQGDTRNAQIKMYFVDITLYHLHSRINPRNIPDYRIARYDDAIKWLKMVASGDITANLPVTIDPDDDQAGLSIKHGSNIKFNHSY